MYASCETMSKGVFRCNMRCTVQICHSWDSLEIQGAGVRNCLSLSERGGTTSYCRAGRRRHHISLRVARRLFNWSSCCPILRVRAHLSVFESTCASERALGDCAHARDVVLARASITCVARVLSLCGYVRMYVSVYNFSELVCDLLPRRLFDGFC